MAIGSSAMCGTFKREILAGIHRLTSSSRGDSSSISADTFKVAMFTNSSSIDADTAQYTTSNEVSGTNYTAGGAALSSVTIGLGDDGSGSTTTALANPSVAVINFGGDKSSSAGDFTIQYPANSATAAIIRIG